MNNKLPILSLALAVLTASLVSLARPIRGASAASSEEFPDIDLPYDAEVEYVESARNGVYVVYEWFDTGIEALPNVSCSVDFQFSTTAVGQSMGQGWRNGSRYSIVGIENGSSFYSFAYNKWVKFPTSADTERHNFSIDPLSGVAAVDATVVEFSGTYRSEGGSIALLCRNCDNGTAQNWGCRGRLFSAQIYVDHDLVRDYIPVRFTNEEGLTEGALYDRISGELFRNAGTGSFIIGPDL